MTIRIRPATNEEIQEQIKIDEDTHNYWLDIPSVSDLKDIKYPFPRDKIRPDILHKAIVKGKHVHKMLEDTLNTGMCEVCCKTQSHAKQFEWMLNWLKENIGKKTAEAEKSFVGVIELDNDKIFFSGTADVVQPNRIIDWKTTSKSKPEQEAFQTTLYALGLGKDLDKTELTIVNGNIKKSYSFDEQAKKLALMDIEQVAIKWIEKHPTIWA